METIIRTVERVFDRIIWSPYSEVRECIENKKLLPADLAVKYSFIDVVGIFPQCRDTRVWQSDTPAVVAANASWVNLTLLLLLETPNQTNKDWFDLKMAMPENYSGVWSRVLDGGNIIELTAYENGIEHGFSKTYENGILTMSCSYMFGHYHDRYEQWYPNGRPKILAFYKNGKLNGKYRTWHVNLKTKESCYYKDGKRLGMYITRFENGNPQMICKYHNDMISGECIKYDDKGSIVFVCSFNENQTHTDL